ncbi:MAG: hypothetical protein ABIH41_06440 [Nanoarchaeota archaeon]
MKTISRHRLKQSPTLNTILMVEDTLKSADESILRVAQIKRMLPRQVNHNMLKTILIYLEESNKIAVTIRGITWIHNTDPRLRNAIRAGTQI